MDYRVQYILSNNFYLRNYLRENSNFYKEIIRNPDFIYKLNDIMKKRYKLTFPDKLEKIKNDISMLNSVMDVLKWLCLITVKR